MDANCPLTDPASLCPRAVNDIRTWTLYAKPAGDLYCVGSLERDKFIAVPESKLQIVLQVVALLDGAHSLEWIQDYFRRVREQDVDVLQLYQLLSSANLIAEPKPQQVFKGEFRRLSIDLLDLNTRAFFEWMQPLARQVYTPLLAFTLVLILLGALSLGSAFRAANNLYVIQESFVWGYIALFAFSLLSLLVHEFSHAFVGAAHGAIARHIKVALYAGLIPYLYTEIAGLYTLSPRERIKVWVAGCYSNLCLGSLALIAYSVTFAQLSPMVGQILLKLALANLFMILGNLWPLMPTDGYFIVSTLLKQVNIRTNALQEFLRWLRGKENQFKGFLLFYFMISGAIILGGAAIQVRWLIGIFYELATGTANASSLQTGLYLSVFALLLLSRIAFSVVQARKKKTLAREG